MLLYAVTFGDSKKSLIQLYIFHQKQVLLYKWSK